jgi:pimeloyl-ACP methyl ester carboxylesterase
MKHVLNAAALRGLGLMSHVAPHLTASLVADAMNRPRQRRKPDAVADSRWRTPSGLQIHVWGDAGPLVLCLHGWEGCGLQFHGLAHHLKEQGFRIWALDAAAHGESPGRRATPIDLLHGLREVHALAAEPVSVVAHSMGAAMAMLAMRDHLTFTRTVLLASPTHFADVFAHFDKSTGLSPRCHDQLFRRVEMQIERRLDTMNLQAAPPSGPALIIHDSNDKVVPLERSLALAKVWPQAHLRVTHGLGHWRVLADQTVWQCIARYLSGEDVMLDELPGAQGEHTRAG